MGGASGHRARMEVGGMGRRGVWKRGMEREERGEQRNIGRGMEEDEGDHTLLTALPWGTSESGERGQ